MEERRCAVRYQLSWPVILEDCSGMTSDISSSGVYFETDRELECGASIDFGLVLPETEDTACHLVCEGNVLRVERRGKEFGIAVHLARMWFENGTLVPLVSRGEAKNYG
jgi:hypothetical protein